MPQPGRQFLCPGDSSISTTWWLFHPAASSRELKNRPESSWWLKKSNRTCYSNPGWTLCSERWTLSSCKLFCLIGIFWFGFVGVFCLLQHEFSGCWQQPSHICMTDISSCICASAHTHVNKSLTWRESYQGRKNASYHRNKFFSRSLCFHPSGF